MNTKLFMVYEACRRYPSIRPCQCKKSLLDSFEWTEDTGWILQFNYDKPDVKGTTGMLTEHHLQKEIHDYVRLREKHFSLEASNGKD